MTRSTKTLHLGGNKLPWNPRWTGAQQVLQINWHALSHRASCSPAHSGERVPNSDTHHCGVIPVISTELSERNIKPMGKNLQTGRIYAWIMVLLNTRVKVAWSSPACLLFLSCLKWHLSVQWCCKTRIHICNQRLQKLFSYPWFSHWPCLSILTCSAVYKYLQMISFCSIYSNKQ